MGTGSFPGVKRPGRDVDHPPHLPPKLKKEHSYTSTPLLGLRGLLSGELCLFYLLLLKIKAWTTTGAGDATVQKLGLWVVIFRVRNINRTYVLYNWEIVVWSPTWARDFFLLKRVHNRSGDSPSLLLLGTGGCFLRKAAGPWSCPLTSI
jgi:hypothetical protein